MNNDDMNFKENTNIFFINYLEKNITSENRILIYLFKFLN
jgi:hypothetical protein